MVLRDVAQGTGRKATLREIGAVVNGDEDDASTRACRQDRGGRGDPVETRHDDVAHDHVGAGGLYRANQRVPVSDRDDDVELWREHVAQLCGHAGVIFGQHDPRTVHGRERISRYGCLRNVTFAWSSPLTHPLISVPSAFTVNVPEDGCDRVT